jgi:hypothetical protein
MEPMNIFRGFDSAKPGIDFWAPSKVYKFALSLIFSGEDKLESRILKNCIGILCNKPENNKIQTSFKT